MALKVELKPNERIIIGACVITNTDQRARLLIDGDRIPILREKDILTPETADTPAKLVYLAVQLMYLSPDPMAHHPTYFSLVRDILTAMPSAWPFIEGINNFILNGDLYHALKESKKLISHEEKLLESARKPSGARRGRRPQIGLDRARTKRQKGLRREALFVNGRLMTAWSRSAGTWSARSGTASTSSDTTPAGWSAAPGSWSPPRPD